MEMPQFGQEQPVQYNQNQSQPGSKKKMILVIAGVIVLMVALVMVLTSGGAPAGQVEMKQALQPAYDALGIIDGYEDKLTLAQTKNDVALSQILIRGNFQKLNEIYNTTYKPKKKFGTKPKPDTASAKILDAAERNNTLDSEIIDVLKPKIATAKKQLKLARSSVGKKSTLEKIDVSIEDLTSIEEILNRPR